MRWPWVSRRRWEKKLSKLTEDCSRWKFSYDKIEKLYLQEKDKSDKLRRENQKLIERARNDRD